MKTKNIEGYSKPRGKKTRSGASENTKDIKKYRGQGGPRKRCKK
jgi:hypothetical protein